MKMKCFYKDIWYNKAQHKIGYSTILEFTI